MQERKKRRIVIASVLKPVDDTRMFEKLGQSLARDYEVHVVGYPGTVPFTHPEIHFHALSFFKRISFARIVAPWKILLKLFRIKPSLLIITTHELLIPGVFAKFFLSAKIVYDVQENYSRNILYTNAFPGLLRPVLAGYVSLKEWLCKPLINYFLLAEKGYLTELDFPESRTIVIENKFKGASEETKTPKRLTEEKIHLLFSGTLSESTGVFTAIDIALRLHAINNHISLTIIGYCPQAETFVRLTSEIKDKPFITLRGGNYLIPHSEILCEIQRADVGIIAYLVNPSTTNSIPTKLFEYLGNQLPILLINHKPWVEICELHQAAIVFDADRFDAKKVLQELRQYPFYPDTPRDVYWSSEEAKLLPVLASLLP